MQLKNRLIQIVNMRFSYRAVDYKINDFRIIAGKVLLSTDKKMLEFDENDFEEIFKRDFDEPIELGKNGNGGGSTEVMNLPSTRLISTIEEEIKKIQSDKKYIPQSRAINNSINTLCNVVKTAAVLKKAIKEN